MESGFVELARSVFGWVCGQAPGHTWAPGDVFLPCCQRCTGLYVGAAVAIVLQVLLRIRPGARFLEAYGVCLLMMIPYGYHLVPQGPVLRTLSGWLFGFGLVGFLMLLPSHRLGWRRASPRRDGLRLGTGCAAGGAILVLLMEKAGSGIVAPLSAVAMAGLLGLLFLVAIQVLWHLGWLVTWIGRRTLNPTPHP